MSDLKKTYETSIRGALKESRGYANVHQVPKITKIVINMGVDVNVDRDALNEASGELALITGQRPAMTRAKKSISNFKLREGVPIGAKVTLRGRRMYDFMDRLINVALPRIRDFRGVPEKLDGRGNYNLGLTEQAIFPEIDPNKVKRTQGMDVTFVTTAETDDEARELLTLFGMPFAKS